MSKLFIFNMYKIFKTIYMSLLNDFDELCEVQNDTLEYKLRKYAIDDCDPIVLSTADLIKKMFIHNVTIGNICEPCSYKDILQDDKVYIYIYVLDNLKIKYTKSSLCKEIGDWNENVIFVYIGDKNGFHGITEREWDIYLNTYKECWGDKAKDISKEMINKCVNLYDADTMISIDNFGKIGKPVSYTPGMVSVQTIENYSTYFSAKEEKHEIYTISTIIPQQYNYEFIK